MSVANRLHIRGHFQQKSSQLRSTNFSNRNFKRYPFHPSTVPFGKLGQHFLDFEQMYAEEKSNVSSILSVGE
ncbi:hypothetical protein N185_16415 [Sinorhizobium sp. GW3]|nr:hypothetical protein N185_16415 [Sinorhizobium sp. GW3]